MGRRHQGESPAGSYGAKPHGRAPNIQLLCFHRFPLSAERGRDLRNDGPDVLRRLLPGRGPATLRPTRGGCSGVTHPLVEDSGLARWWPDAHSGTCPFRLRTAAAIVPPVRHPVLLAGPAGV